MKHKTGHKASLAAYGLLVCSSLATAYTIWGDDVKSDVIYASGSATDGTVLIYRGDERKDSGKNPGMMALKNGLPPANKDTKKLDIADHVNNDPKGHFLSFSYSAKSAAGWAGMIEKPGKQQYVYVLCAASPKAKISAELSSSHHPVVVGIDAYKTLKKYESKLPTSGQNIRRKLLTNSGESQEVLVEGHIDAKYLVMVCSGWDKLNGTLDSCTKNTTVGDCGKGG